jgi:hypothetical protein
MNASAPGTPSIRLNVIVVSMNRPRLLRRCLETLTLDARETEGVEVAVVGDWDSEPDMLVSLRDAFPETRWINAPPGATVPAKRWLGIDGTKEEVFALLEDDCVVPAGWCRALRLAHRSDVAIGGAIEPGCYRSGLDWAVYFCEYARFMMPFAGRVASLPGNNVSYKRALLKQFERKEWRAEGFYEGDFHRELRAAGISLLAEPSLAVTNVNSWGASQVLGVPFHHGRAFAGRRLRGRGSWRRPLFAGFAILLPLVQVSRVLREVASRRRLLARLISAMPWVALFCVSWSAGELVGYLTGAGRSAERWR